MRAMNGKWGKSLYALARAAMCCARAFHTEASIFTYVHYMQVDDMGTSTVWFVSSYWPSYFVAVSGKKFLTFGLNISAQSLQTAIECFRYSCRLLR